MYVSPHLEYAAGQYGTVITLKNKDDKSDVRRFVLVFQVACKPGTRLKSSFPGGHTGSKELDGIFSHRYEGHTRDLPLSIYSLIVLIVTNIFVRFL